MILRTRLSTRRATRTIATIGLAVAVAGLCARGVPTASATNKYRGKYLGSVSNVALNRPVVGIAATRSGHGYWLVAADGGIFTFGDAHYYGSTSTLPLTAPIVGIAATRSGHGYWLVAADGGVFSFGDARFHGSTGQRKLAAPIVGIAATRSGHGYWLVAADGGIFTFGDARYYGTRSRQAINAPIVGMTATPSGRGYWLAASDGSVIPFGDARFFGSARGTFLPAPIIGMTATSTGNGYWLATADGNTYAFGHARAFATAFPSATRSPAPAGNAVVTIVATPGGGYWVASRTGTVGVSTKVAPRAAGPAVSRPDPGLIEFQLVVRMNAEREARRERPLRWDSLLAERAKAWAQTLLVSDTFHHQNLLTVAAASDGRFEEVGENIYSGTGSADDAGTAHLAFMHSTDHRQNMLLPQGQLVGIGAACGGGKLVVVEDFAIRMGAPLPPPNQPIPPVNPVVAPSPSGAHC